MVSARTGPSTELVRRLPADALTKAFAETIGKMYARGVTPRFEAAGQKVAHKMSVVITRIGWFVRNTAEAVALAEGEGFNVYLSHDDAARYFVRLIESPTPAAGDSAIVFAMSKTPDGHAPLVDLSPAKDVLGYEPRDIFPSGVPFPDPGTSAKL